MNIFNEKVDFNVKFSGDYDLLKWILVKYKEALPYDGKIESYGQKTFYSEKNISHFWKNRGVPIRVWNQLHKDLTLARLLGRIDEKDIKTLKELESIFNSYCAKLNQIKDKLQEDYNKFDNLATVCEVNNIDVDIVKIWARSNLKKHTILKRKLDPNKKEILAALDSSKPVKEIANQYKVTVSAIYRWLDKIEA